MKIPLNCGMQNSSKKSFDKLSEKAEEQLEFWKTNPYDRSLYKAEVEFVVRNAPPPGVVVELGCGWDPYIELVSKGHKLIAIDFSLDSLKKVQAKYPGTPLLHTDKNNLPIKINSIDHGMTLVYGDVNKVLIEDQCTDLVIATDELICCDTVNPPQMLAEVHRILRPGGFLVLEYDTKWCFDTFWMLLDSFLGNFIGYEVTREQMIKLFRFSGGGTIKWGLPRSEEIVDIRFFTHKEIHRMLNQIGFRILKQRGVLIFAGIVPTVVQQQTKSKGIIALSSFLAIIDKFIGELPLFNSLGGDTILLAQKIT